VQIAQTQFQHSGFFRQCIVQLHQQPPSGRQFVCCIPPSILSLYAAVSDYCRPAPRVGSVPQYVLAEEDAKRQKHTSPSTLMLKTLRSGCQARRRLHTVLAFTHSISLPLRTPSTSRFGSGEITSVEWQVRSQTLFDPASIILLCIWFNEASADRKG
jgi:hypothetical protein